MSVTSGRTPSRTWTMRDILSVYERSSGICGICGERVVADDATIDHIVPRAAGGSNDLDNLQLAHRRCNSIKSDRQDYQRAASQPGKEYIGARLREHRESTDVTQKQLAKLSGVPIVTISRIENGHHDPYQSTIQRLALALKVDPRWLAWGEE